MPIYTYKCSKCSQTFDRLEGVTYKEEELKCPKCGNKKVEKQFSAFSVGKSLGRSSAPSCPTGTCNLD
jgi:putative FmdB family regulatory protein